MKKIVLALVVAVVACVVVFASQDVKCRQAAVYSSFEQVTPDGFRRIGSRLVIRTGARSLC